MAGPPTGTQFSLQKLTLPVKIAIGVGLTSVIAFGWWFIFESDLASKIEGARRKNVQLRGTLSEKQVAQDTFIHDREELNRLKQRSVELSKLLPPDAQEATFLSSIQTASNVSGIDLKAYAPLDEQVQPFYAKVPMRVEFTGKFHQIAKFAYEVGKLDRIINVENMELSEPKVSGEEVILHGRCLTTAFHALKPKEPVAPK